jgi:replicative DNA helicase
MSLALASTTETDSWSDGVEAPVEVIVEPKPERYEFNAEFQDKIVALMLRDSNFLLRTEGLVDPGFFESVDNILIAGICLRYYKKYRKAPGDLATFKMLISTEFKKKILRRDYTTEVLRRIADTPAVNPKHIYGVDVSDRELAIDQVAEFARHQAVANTTLEIAEILETSRDFELISEKMRRALDVGANLDAADYDFAEQRENRTRKRKEKAAGLLPPSGITTGLRELDKALFHEGWGRGELSVLLGGAKAGKTTGLISFGINAIAAGFNVLYVTLEVSADIISDRMDANIGDQAMMELGTHILEVDSKVKKFMEKAGIFRIREYPSGSMKVSDLRRTIESYKSKGINFDLVVVDYADLMAPERMTDNSIENSKNVYVNLRGLAMQEKFAILTATQTNREGFKSTVVKAEHVAEDFNKIRIADLIISINKTDEERLANEARLYFAASRNQAGNFTIRIQQDVDRMRFITKVLGKDG